MGARAQRGKLGEDHWRKLAMESNYCVESAARQFGLSQRQFQRVFAKEVGKTPKRWFKAQRLKHAKQLLLENATTKEAAYGSGYTQVTNFARDFKRQFRFPAGKYQDFQN